MIESKSFPREMLLTRAPEQKRARIFRYLAPPRFWGPWHPIVELNSGANISIDTRSLAQISSFYNAEVTYLDRRVQRQTVEFGVIGSIRIQAGRVKKPFTQTVKVRFKSSFTGQTIWTRVDY